MTKERGAEITLSGYFRQVERRLAEIAGEVITRDIRIDGRRIRQHFLSRDEEEMVVPSFVGLYEEAAGEPDADFYFWTDELVPYLPEGSGSGPGIWTSRDGTGYLYVNMGYGLVGADHLRRRYYICLQNRDEDPDTSPEAHAMVIALFRWALDTDRLVLHSAAVGAGGKGVLVGARGGQGKSTLSAACLMRGWILSRTITCCLPGAALWKRCPSTGHWGLIRICMSGWISVFLCLEGIRKGAESFCWTPPAAGSRSAFR